MLNIDNKTEEKIKDFIKWEYKSKIRLTSLEKINDKYKANFQIIKCDENFNFISFNQKIEVTKDKFDFYKKVLDYTDFMKYTFSYF